MKNSALWQKIKDFPLDDPGSDFTFSQRLARDNNWSHEFALRAIREYKKFIYLCCTAGTQITPSDAVDQVWHQHLTFTKSYWIDLCRNTLNQPIHHNPTKGGESERVKYSECYDQTFEKYKSEFGEEPIADIWLDNFQRFNKIDFKRINLSDYWLIRRPQFSVLTLFLLVIAEMVLFLFVRSESNIPWFSFIFLAVVILFLVRGFRGGGGKGKGGNKGSGSGAAGWWTGFWGCSTDSDHHSGCGGHGCGSGCGSGCGGGGD